MGCDIHAVVAVRRDDKWAPVKEIPIGRNYGLFTALAMVRMVSLTEPCFPARGRLEGFPYIGEDEDSCLIDNEVVWVGEHSYSYVTLAELRCIQPLWSKAHFLPELLAIMGHMNYVYQSAMNVRAYDVALVFGFDS